MASLIKDCLFASTIPLRTFGKVHQCRPRLLAWSLFKESLQGVVDGSGSRAVGLDVGGDGFEAVMNITGFCQQESQLRQVERDKARPHTCESRLDERSSEALPD
jgi:hypothetical protein